MKKYIQMGLGLTIALSCLVSCTDENLNQVKDAVSMASQESGVKKNVFIVTTREHPFILYDADTSTPIEKSAQKLIGTIAPDGQKAVISLSNNFDFLSKDGRTELNIGANGISTNHFFQWSSDSQSFVYLGQVKGFIDGGRPVFGKYDLNSKEVSVLQFPEGSGLSGDNLSSGFGFSPDLKILAIISNENTPNNDYFVHLLNWESGKVTRLDSEAQTSRSYTPSRSIIWSPNNDQLAFRKDDPMKNGAVVVYQPTGKRVKELNTKGEPVAWSPDGSKILLRYTETERQPVIEDINSGDQLRLEALPENGNFSSYHFSPDGSQVAVGDSSNTIIYDTTTGKKVTEHPYNVIGWTEVNLEIFKQVSK